jgi:phage head maturation protease
MKVRALTDTQKLFLEGIMPLRTDKSTIELDRHGLHVHVHLEEMTAGNHVSANCINHAMCTPTKVV